MDRHTAVGAAVHGCQASSLAQREREREREEGRKKKELQSKKKELYFAKIIHLDQSINPFNPIKTLPLYLYIPLFYSVLLFLFSPFLPLPHTLVFLSCAGTGPAQHISKISSSDNSLSPNPAIMKSYAIVASCGFGRSNTNQT